MAQALASFTFCSSQALSSRPRCSRRLIAARNRLAVHSSRVASVTVQASYREEQEKKTVEQRKEEMDGMISKWKQRMVQIDAGQSVEKVQSRSRESIYVC